MSASARLLIVTAVILCLGQGAAVDEDEPLAAGDVVWIRVWREPFLTKGPVRVRPDGRISFPLVGELDAAGKTPHQLARSMAKSLARYIRNPSVLVWDDRGREGRSMYQGPKRGTYIYLKPGETILVP